MTYRKINNHLPLLSLLILFFTGCIEESRQTGLSGKLEGNISSFDKNLNTLSDQSGVEIRIEGGRETILLMTDSDGKFETELNTGTYDIILSKDGFGTHKIIGYGFVGGGNPSEVSGQIYELPSAVVENIEVKDMSNSFQVLMECRVFVDLPANASNSGIYRYYLNNTSTISVSNYLEAGVVYANAGSGSFIFLELINTSMFPVGTDVFLMVGPCTEPDQNYIDLETGNLIFSSVASGAAKVISFKVPG